MLARVGDLGGGALRGLIGRLAVFGISEVQVSNPPWESELWIGIPVVWSILRTP